MKKTFRRITAFALVLLMTAGTALAYISKPAAWAEAEVGAARQLSLAPESLFADFDRPTTRAEFCDIVCAFLTKVTGYSLTELSNKLFPDGYNKKPFNDTDDREIAFCAAVHIVSGREAGIFDPYGMINREEAAKMLSLAALLVTDGSYPERATFFADGSLINSWGKDPVRYVSGFGIMNGRDDRTFDPRANYTRQESLLTFYRLYLHSKSGVRERLGQISYPYRNFAADGKSVLAMASKGEVGILANTAADKRLNAKNGKGSLLLLNPAQSAAFFFIQYDEKGNLVAYPSSPDAKLLDRAADAVAGQAADGYYLCAALLPLSDEGAVKGATTARVTLIQDGKTLFENPEVLLMDARGKTLASVPAEQNSVCALFALSDDVLVSEGKTPDFAKSFILRVSVGDYIAEFQVNP